MKNKRKRGVLCTLLLLVRIAVAVIMVALWLLICICAWAAWADGGWRVGIFFSIYPIGLIYPMIVGLEFLFFHPPTKGDTDET
ncbi:MAG: hypothetical protein EOM20_16605 [Spartobacteria bacterium]|nr:hypothetical protein [Spartobacteria bacterium]